jgi:hypothetical protein
MKTMKEEGVEGCSLTRNTSRGGGGKKGMLEFRDGD